MSARDQGEARRLDVDEVIIAALAAGQTYAEAAAIAGVSARTVRRRMSEPEFAREVSTRRGEHMAVVTGQLLSAGPDAVAVLREALSCDQAPVRLRAAQLLLSLGAKSRAVTDWESRLAAVEAASWEEQSS